MSDTITLTRAQWTAIWDGLDGIRDRFDDICQISSAMIVLGLNKPAEAIDAIESDIISDTLRLQGILIDADNAASPAKAIGLKIRLFNKWFWPLNKSNREA